MDNAARERDRFLLPARVRSRKPPTDGFSSRLALADRIADLAGICAIEQESDTVPYSVDVYLGEQTRTVRNGRAPVLLCSISREGIEIQGLGDWDKYQVLCKGWGKLHRDRVSIYLPRDNGELEVCWSILQRAYRFLTKASDLAPSPRTIASWDLPRFSRTPHH
ncbi:MAG: hypothetical protein OEO82_13160 [Gammaproteobacteria bacterium]|nr:hypothetical protein [Gammaproteobacteria bacterium]